MNIVIIMTNEGVPTMGDCIITQQQFSLRNHLVWLKGHVSENFQQTCTANLHQLFSFSYKVCYIMLKSFFIA